MPANRSGLCSTRSLHPGIAFSNPVIESARICDLAPSGGKPMKFRPGMLFLVLLPVSLVGLYLLGFGGIQSATTNAQTRTSSGQAADGPPTKQAQPGRTEPATTTDSEGLRVSQNATKHAAAPAPGSAGVPTTPARPSAASQQSQRPLGFEPIGFEPNMGQAAPNVLYTARASGYSVLLTSNKALLTLTRHASASTGEKTQNQQSTVSISLAGASAKPQARPLSKLSSTSNYFIGDNPKRWHTGVPNYASVALEGVYPGIDMVYHGDNHRLEYDFVVAPGSDPNRIGLSIDGAERVGIDSGDLVIETPSGSIRQLRPLAYQETNGARQEVACGYHLIGTHDIGLELGSYDRSRQLVIDPVIDYTTYLGGSGYDDGFAVAVDSAGN